MAGRAYSLPAVITGCYYKRGTTPSQPTNGRELNKIMKQIRIYSSSDCYYCDRAKVLLGKKGVDYEEIDVEQNREAMLEVIKQTGRQTVPQIFIGDYYVGGCDDLYALDAQGKLDSLLGLEA